jgi:malate/lactate dehydrogenase
MRILVIGVGRIGGGLVYELMKHGNCTILLYGRDFSRTSGMAADLRELNPSVEVLVLEHLRELPPIDLTVFSFSQLVWHSELLVNGRIIDARTNITIIDSIAAQVSLNTLGTIIILSNPPDILSRYCYEKYGADNVYGFGNSLDELRVRNTLIQMQLPHNGKECICLGEHGAGMVPVLSQVFNDKELDHALYDRVNTAVFDRIHQIIHQAYIPFYGPLLALTELIMAIINKETRQVTLSCYLDKDYLGQRNLSMGVPVELNAGVFGKIVEVEVSDFEKELFAQSAKSLDAQYQQVVSK